MFIGIIPWFFIQDSITQGAKELRINRQFITKVKFPVSTILTYTEVSRLFVHLILMAFMYAYVLFTIGPSWYNLQFFLYCPLMFIFFLALTWSTAPMSAFSKDFESLIVSVMSGIFWLSGIMYNSYGFDSPFLNKLMLINPINFFRKRLPQLFPLQQTVLCKQNGMSCFCNRICCNFRPWYFQLQQTQEKTS